MREILFRGKDTDSGKWIYGGYCQHDKIKVCFTTDDPKTKYMIINDGSCDWGFEPPLQGYDVDPKTVGQFIGVIDKNGKKVFEGDVIKFHKYRYEPDWVGAVCYEYCSYVVKGRMPLAYEKRIGEDPFYCPFEVALSGVDKTRIEIIGNIYDNPGLVDEDVIGGDGERRTPDVR